MSRREKKAIYEKRLHSLLDTYDKAFLVGADNVGSKQFQDIRRGLRGESEILMGKNTLMKRCIRTYIENTGDNSFEVFLPYLVGNVGIVFTKGDLLDVKDEIAKYKVPAPARVGAAVQVDVYVEAGMTSMDPSQTSFFQALNISTKINKGNIEILTDVHLLKLGEKVGASEAALLGKLGVKPFSYGLVLEQVYDNGSLFAPAVLDITDDDMCNSVAAAVQQVAAACLELNYPTLASVPHSVINGYKNVLAIALECDEYSFELADKVKEVLANPEAFAAAAAPAASAAAPAAAAAPEPEEESDEDAGFDLFD